MLLSREKAAIPQSPAGGSLTSADRDQSNEVKPTVEAFFALRDYQVRLNSCKNQCFIFHHNIGALC